MAQPAKILLLLLLLITFPLPNRAHQTSDSYLALTLTNSYIEGRWSIALRDLNHVLEIDKDKEVMTQQVELLHRLFFHHGFQ